MFGRASKLDRGLDAFERRAWKRARRLLEEALNEEPRANGFYHLGLLYWRGLGGEIDKSYAAECFARAAEDGHPGAQTAYGIALRTGVGAARDEAAARAQFRAAAGGGDREAMVQLAAMSPADEQRRWLRRACELGYAPAMHRLAETLIPTDPVEALAWLYAVVAVAGDEQARKLAAALAKEMSAKEIDAAQKTGDAYAKNIRQQAKQR